MQGGHKFLHDRRVVGLELDRLSVVELEVEDQKDTFRVYSPGIADPANRDRARRRQRRVDEVLGVACPQSDIDRHGRDAARHPASPTSTRIGRHPNTRDRSSASQRHR